MVIADLEEELASGNWELRVWHKERQRWVSGLGSGGCGGEARVQLTWLKEKERT